MSRHIKIKKGLTIKLNGEAERLFSDQPLSETFAVKPTDFVGLIPRLLVRPGDEVLAGTPLFQNKLNEKVRFCAPVSGEVLEVLRGEKRKILEIRILADKEIKFATFPIQNPENNSREEVVAAMLEGGLWPFIRQRPFGTIANPEELPKSIFISAFDSNPLAPDNNFIFQNCSKDFQTGLNALRKLSGGKVHLNIPATQAVSKVFTEAIGVQINTISGPHPAGNVGVQIHHIDPVCKGEVVWCVQPQDVLIIGRYFNHGQYNASRMVAVTGSGVVNRKYYKTYLGCNVKNMLAEGVVTGAENRIISGNVLTGKIIGQDGFLNFYDTQITVIPEGNEPEFMGWLTPGFKKLSMSRAFFSWLTPNKYYDLNTNMHGEERPFVVTGQYEKVFPMDIYPVQLLKSILIDDIEMMENLGIYEVVEEDFALCEFVCTSKIESQKIIRKGLDLIRKEFS